jgi:hypothetical protein
MSACLSCGAPIQGGAWRCDACEEKHVAKRLQRANKTKPSGLVHCPRRFDCWADPPDGQTMPCPHMDPHEPADTCGAVHPDCPKCEE